MTGLALLALLVAPDATAVEPHPDSREVKLLLEAAPFADRRPAFEQYWAVVVEATAEHGVGVLPTHQPFAERHRRVVFLDTEDHALRARGFTLRQRADYLGERPDEVVELAVKYRSPDLEEVTGRQLRTPRFASTTELEEDVGYDADAPQHLRHVYSKRTRIDTDWRPGRTLSGWKRFFPDLLELGIPKSAPVVPVHGAHLEEYRVSPGRLDFGDGLVADADLTLWTEADHTPLIAEFSFGHPVDPLEPEPAVDRMVAFFLDLRVHSQDWLAEGTTKTAFTYGRTPPPAEEH